MSSAAAYWALRGAESFPVPPGPLDFTWGKRKGATWASSLLARPVDYRQWATILGKAFHHRFHTQVNVTSARWPSLDPVAIWPFQKVTTGNDAGKFDLYAKNPEFWGDRLPRYLEAMNQQGGIVQFCLFDLYQFSDRKSGTPDKNFSPVRYNVNGVYWPGDDTFLATKLPDAWLLWLTEELAKAIAGAHAGVVLFNEGPEKDIHESLARVVKQFAPNVWTITNRNEDTAGQYLNMHVGKPPIDMIAFHGWKSQAFLDKSWGGPDEYPRTFRQFFNKKNDKGQTINVDFARVICSSDGSRQSSSAGGNDLIDPAKPWHEWRIYNWPTLLKVFQYVLNKGGNVEHQSVLKMDRTDDVKFDLTTAEVGFYDQMEALSPKGT